jgi:hypothetical protein
MDKIALTNVRVFDGERLLEPTTVVIDGDRIGDDQAGARTWEGDGGVLLPGLIDCHIHLTDESTLSALAAHGVTTALDMGTDSPELVASLRNRPGVTDVRSSGASATSPASAHAKRMGRSEGLVADPDEARAYVSRRVAEGVDYIKIIIDLPGFAEPTVRKPHMRRACARSPTPPRVRPCCSRRQPASTYSPTRPSTGNWRTAPSSVRAHPGRSSCPP